MEKTKYVCTYASEENKDNFTVGKIYEGYSVGPCDIEEDRGKTLTGLTIEEDFNDGVVNLEPLMNVAFMVECMIAVDPRFEVGEQYFVGVYKDIYGQPFYSYSRGSNYLEWIALNFGNMDAFKLIKDYTKPLKQETDTIKENLSNVLQDIPLGKYKIIEKHGVRSLKLVNEVCIAFVKFNCNCKSYLFLNPTGKMIKEGTKVKVDTVHGHKDATVVSSIKIPTSQVKKMIKGISGKNRELKPIVGIYKEVLVPVEDMMKVKVNG